MKKRLLLLLLAFSLLTLSGLLFPRFAFSQGSLGVVWKVPESESQAVDNLQIFKKAGIKYLIINSNVSPQIVDTIQAYSFKIYVNIPVLYPTTVDLQQKDSQYFQKYQEAIHRFNKYKSVEAFGLFENGELSSEMFNRRINIYLKRLESLTSKKLFYLQNYNEQIPSDTSFAFNIQLINEYSSVPKFNDISIRKIRGFYFNPIERHFYEPRKITHLFNWAQSAKVPVFLNATWLLNVIQKHHDFTFALKDYLNGSPLILSSVKPSQRYDIGKSVTVFFLLIIWGILALHYYFEPNYGKSVNRYFTTHNFFVDDVMDRLTRLPNSNLIILVLQGVIGGMFFYTLGKATLSDSGFQSLIQHYPILGILDGNFFSLFIFGFLLITLYNIICIIWIFFGVSEVKFIGQALTIFTWPQHLNILLITVMITFWTSNLAGIFFLIPAVLFLSVIIFSFYITVFDTARFSNKKFIQHLKTTIPHFIILAGLIYLLLTRTQIVDALRLAVHL